MRRDARTLQRALVVEDDPVQRRGIARVLSARGLQVLQAGGTDEAIALLSPPPDLVVVDVHLRDDLAFSVLEATAGLWPTPIRIAISGVATAEEAFRLSSFGVRSFLQKPFSAEDLERAIDSAIAEAPDPGPMLADVVGHRSVRDVQAEVRHRMVRQALALSGGSRSAAARLLQVSRQAVQQMMRKGLDPSGPSDPKQH